MPKIIPDLAKRILDTAASHFETKGFEGTDMKSLATELGISVGALYNYHPSKPELFLAVGDKWKLALTERLLSRIEKETTPDAKLRTALLMLYENMEHYTGIWVAYMRSGAHFGGGSAMAQRLKRDSGQLSQTLQGLFREAWKDRPHAQALVDDESARLAQLAIGSIMQLLVTEKEDRQANRAFVEKWVNFLAPAQAEGKSKTPGEPGVL